MEVLDAVKKRKSIRAFKPDPVPLEVVKNIMEPALRAPSWANTQPWEFAVAAGAKLKEIQDGFVAKGGEPPQSEIPFPLEFPEPYLGRMRALQPREMTPEETRQWMLMNFRNYGAPVCIYLLIGKDFYFQSHGVNSWALYDCGSCVENILLLATAQGLGAIVHTMAVSYPDVIHAALGIPEDKAIVLGISIGYPDWDNPINQGWTPREPLGSVATFYGF